MTDWGSVYFIALLTLTILSTLFSFKVKFLAASIASGIFWLGLLVTFLLDPTMVQFGHITFVGTQIYALGIVTWIFVVLAIQMRTDITHEKSVRGKDGREESASYTEHKWNKTHTPSANERQLTYKMQIRAMRRK